MKIEEVEALVQEAFGVGMLQSGVEARDFAIWCSERDIANVCELGSCAGGMLYLLDRVCKPGLRISLDMPWAQRDPDCHGLQARCKAALPGMIEILGQIHEETQRQRLANVLVNARLDLLFIDADHTAEGCRQHVEMYGPFVRPGGYIGFHDLSNGWPCGPWIRETLFPKHRHWIFEEPANLFGIGVIQLPNLVWYENRIAHP